MNNQLSSTSDVPFYIHVSLEALRGFKDRKSYFVHVRMKQKTFLCIACIPS